MGRGDAVKPWMIVRDSNLWEVAEWCGADSYWGPQSPAPRVFVPTRKGERHAVIGDLVVRLFGRCAVIPLGADR